MRIGIIGVLVLLVLSACASPRLAPAGEVVRVAGLEEVGDGEFMLIARDGYRLPVSYWGEGSDNGLSAADKVIIGLHSFGDYRLGFEEVGEWFSGESVHLYAMDMRGFGETENIGIWAGSETYSDDLVDMISVIRRRHPNLPIYVMGESMGASVALIAAAEGKIPGVSGLILASPAVRNGTRMRYVVDATSWGLSRGLPFLTIPTSRSFYDNLTPRSLERLGHDPLVLRKLRPDAFDGLIDMMDEASAAADNVAIPSLILYGNLDNVVRAVAVCDLYENLPHRVGVQYLYGPHLALQWEETSIIHDDILAWLDRRELPSLYHELPSGQMVSVSLGERCD